MHRTHKYPLAASISAMYLVFGSCHPNMSWMTMMALSDAAGGFTTYALKCSIWTSWPRPPYSIRSPISQGHGFASFAIWVHTHTRARTGRSDGQWPRSSLKNGAIATVFQKQQKETRCVYIRRQCKYHEYNSKRVLKRTVKLSNSKVKKMRV